MKFDFFWLHWPKQSRVLFIILAGCTILALAYMAVNSFLGVHQFIDWNILATPEKASVTLSEYQVGPFSLPFTIENTVFFQRYLGTAPLISPWSYYLFALAGVITTVFITTAISTFSRFWFYLGTALFTLFLVSLRIESLLLFDSNEKIGLITALVLYLPALYFFNKIKPEASLLIRILIFSVLTITLAAFFVMSSTIADPLWYLSTSMIMYCMIISIIFIFTVSHEILAGFVYLLFGNSNTSNRQNLPHFLIISVIYLINLVLAYMHETGMIDWDILYINVYLLLAISAILGVWGFRHRQFQYEGIIDYKTAGYVLYFSGALICFITIGHFFQTGHDAGLEVIRDFTLYGHIGYGLAFILYVLANFGGLLKSDKPVYRVIYKPTSMPYFTFRFAGTIVVAAFVLKANWKVPVFQQKAAQFNSVADYHYRNGETLLAERYYTEASEYALYNHKSNYSLGIINERKNNDARAIVRYNAAVTKYPSAQAYANIANIYENQGRFFDALFVLKDASKHLSSNELNNMMGLLYSSTSLLDSAAHYFLLGDEHRGLVSTSNMLALSALHDLPYEAEELTPGDTEDILLQNNLMALANNNRQVIKASLHAEGSEKSPIALELHYNSYVNRLFGIDTVDIAELAALETQPAPASMIQKLKFIKSLHLYKNGRVNEAFRQLNWIGSTTETVAADYFDKLGIWALEQQAPDVATTYFQYALERGHEAAALHLAIALSEDLKTIQALDQWKQLTSSSDPAIAEMGGTMSQLLSAPFDPQWDDNAKYLYMRYQLTPSDTVMFRTYHTSLQSDDLKARAILDMARKLYKRNLIEAAINTYSGIADLQIGDDVLFNDLQHFELKLLAAQSNIRGLAQKINQGVTFDRKPLDKAYYTGIIAAASNDSTTASVNFNYLANKNPFFEDANIRSAAFFNEYDIFKAYHILLEALEVNPQSVKLLEAYIYQCGRTLQKESAEIALETIKPLITTQEFKRISGTYAELKQAAQTAW